MLISALSSLFAQSTVFFVSTLKEAKNDDAKFLIFFRFFNRYRLLLINERLILIDHTSFPAVLDRCLINAVESRFA